MRNKIINRVGYTCSKFMQDTFEVHNDTEEAYQVTVVLDNYGDKNCISWDKQPLELDYYLTEDGEERTRVKVTEFPNTKSPWHINVMTERVQRVPQKTSR